MGFLFVVVLLLFLVIIIIDSSGINDIPVSALTLLIARQGGHPACKKTGCWFVGGGDLTGALHDL